VVVVFLLISAGCAYKFTQTTPRSATRRPLDCVFEVLTRQPDQPFSELGVLDFMGGAAKAAPDARSFAQSVRRDVCRAGGDAVLAEVNGRGKYIRGTVIKYRTK